jgi:cell division septum initiation protein DivIVA
VDLEEEQLRAQNRQLEDELVAATFNAQRSDVAMNELRARETAVSLREASVAERERIVEHAAAQAMRELASVRERARRLSLLEGDTRA